MLVDQGHGGKLFLLVGKPILWNMGVMSDSCSFGRPVLLNGDVVVTAKGMPL